MTEKSGVPLLRLPVWRIPKRGRVGESCDLSFLPSSGVLLKVAGISRQQKAPMTRRRREGVQVDHSGRSWGSRPGPSHNLRNPLQRRYYFQRFPPTICSSPAAGLPLGVVEMIIARRAQPRVCFELLHLAGRCYSPHSPHPYRNHSNLLVEYNGEQGASVTQTASEDPVPSWLLARYFCAFSNNLSFFCWVRRWSGLSVFANDVSRNDLHHGSSSSLRKTRIW